MDTENTEEMKEKGKNHAALTVLPDEKDLRLDRWIKRHFPGVTHGQLQKWLRTGQIRVDGKRVDSSHRLDDGNRVRLPPNLLEDPAFAQKTVPGKGRPIRNPEKLKSFILFEDEDVVALNKPAGLAVQGGTGLKENLDDSLMALSLDGVTRPKLVHRLDRDTSGVLLIARNDFAAAKLTAAFRARTTQKVYWAITKGAPLRDEGMIEEPLIKSGQIMRIAEDGDDETLVKSATTLYQVVERAHRKAAFIALWPLTGRTHQLRVHLASIGAPIWGDPLYGPEIDEEDCDFPIAELGRGLHLHARRLIIPHPRRGMIDVTAPLGPVMRKTWRWFNFDEKADVSFDDPFRKRGRR